MPIQLLRSTDIGHDTIAWAKRLPGRREFQLWSAKSIKHTTPLSNQRLVVAEDRVGAGCFVQCCYARYLLRSGWSLPSLSSLMGLVGIMGDDMPEKGENPAALGPCCMTDRRYQVHLAEWLRQHIKSIQSGKMDAMLCWSSWAIPRPLPRTPCWAVEGKCGQQQ
jgi:hypothetical protein